MSLAQFISCVESQIGRPYVWGGDSPSTGFDCSGLMYWAAIQAGHPIPRTSQAQWVGLQRVGSPQRGDLVFFDVPADGGSQPAHVGMYESPNVMVDAPRPGVPVSRQPFPFSGGTVMGYCRIPFPTPPKPPAPPTSPASVLMTDLGVEVPMSLFASVSAAAEYAVTTWYGTYLHRPPTSPADKTGVAYWSYELVAASNPASTVSSADVLTAFLVAAGDQAVDEANEAAASR
jgi:hypothetical protein